MGGTTDDLDDSVDHQRADAQQGTGFRVGAGQVAMDTERLADLLLALGHATTRGDFAVYRRDELEEARTSGYAQGWQDAMRAAGERAQGSIKTGGADVIRIREQEQDAHHARPKP
ncbi:hypothetical protein [Streptomyces indicus]|uniref:Uncharacterized protein n=1 Tax=Streptomyces indicus TaxID=417292 RepID=A0A1G9C8Z9_9ACTN|nr:hypothetical protein [Streptomyces indicus]SDK48113.1 hypothetical protein SAMN05421806_1084 [Streptomyces indicus]